MLHGELNRVLRTVSTGLNIAGAVFTAAVVIVGLWSLWGPLTRPADNASQRMEALQGLLRDEGRLRTEHARLCQQLEAARQKDEALRNRIPDGPQEADFLAQVSRAAGEVGLQITDYRHSGITGGKLCSAMRVELSCEGDYQSICSLLDRLQELPRYSTVARLEINSIAPQAKCLAKICLELYFFVGDRQPAERHA
jgi:Tfp pilus assembly protein PilO